MRETLALYMMNEIHVLWLVMIVAPQQLMWHMMSMMPRAGGSQWHTVGHVAKTERKTGSYECPQQVDVCFCERFCDTEICPVGIYLSDMCRRIHAGLWCRFGSVTATESARTIQRLDNPSLSFLLWVVFLKLLEQVIKITYSRIRVYFISQIKCICMFFFQGTVCLSSMKL